METLLQLVQSVNINCDVTGPVQFGMICFMYNTRSYDAFFMVHFGMVHFRIYNTKMYGSL